MRPHRDGKGALIVVKVGGGVSAIPGGLGLVGTSLAEAAKQTSLVVIPGGGAFADAVRAFDKAHGLTPDAAHWMAILGMDQFAHVLAAATPDALIVESSPEMKQAVGQGQVPILAPYRWLRRADELPRSWEVTSDSLAAYLAGLLGAIRLILVKPVESDRSDGRELVDPYFFKALPAGLEWTCVTPTGFAAWSRTLPPRTGA
jgi:dihydroneopterin aldolase